MANRLDIVASDGKIIEAEHSPCGLIREAEPPLLVDDDDAFDHAGQDRLHLGVIAIQLGQAPAELLDRSVQGSRHDAQLVGAVVEAGRPQIAGAVAPGHFGDRAHARTDSSRHDPGNRRGPGERQAEREHGQPGDWLELASNAREGKRDAHDADARMVDRRGHVEHVDIQRVAVAARLSEARRARRQHLGPLRMILHRGDALDRFRRIADDAAVGRNERHARIEQLSHPIGFLVEARRWRAWGGGRARKELRRQAGFRDQRVLDPLVGLLAHRLGEQKSRHGEREDRRRERGCEQGGAETAGYHGWRQSESICGILARA